MLGLLEQALVALQSRLVQEPGKDFWVILLGVVRVVKTPGDRRHQLLHCESRGFLTT